MNYYLWISGEEHGPYALEQIRAAVENGTINAQQTARTEDNSDWKPISQLVHLTAAKPAAKPQQPAQQSKPAQAPTTQTTSTPSSSSGGITRNQGSIIVALLCIGLGFPFLSFLKPAPRWEYKKLVFLTDGQPARTGFGARDYNSIKLDESLLESMGSQGWELVTSYLEMETAFPNFGKEDYVTGLQPNIRPQSLVLIFKHPK